MPLILHAHPLSSFCQKVLLALYELEVPFEFRLLDLSDAAARTEHLARWPKGKMPVLEDPGVQLALPETSIIIEYLDRHHGHGGRLLPGDPDACLEVRLWDRISDFYVMLPMQRAVAARLAGDLDAAERVRQEVGDELEVAYDLLEARLAGHPWLGADAFTMADCAAMPALFYASARAGGVFPPPARARVGRPRAARSRAVVAVLPAGRKAAGCVPAAGLTLPPRQAAG